MTKEERSSTCPICGGKEFTRENGRIFKTTFTATKVTLMICKECHH